MGITLRGRRSRLGKNVDDSCEVDAKVKELRKKISEVDHPAVQKAIRDERFCDEYCKRFLVARDWVIDGEDKAFEMLRDHFIWRDERNVDNIYKEHAAGRLMPEIAKIKEFYPNGYCGITKSGSPVCYGRLGMMQVKKVLEVVSEDRFLDYFIGECERCWWEKFPMSTDYCIEKGILTWDDRSQTPRPRILKMTHVVDVSGAGMNLLDKTTRSVMKKLSATIGSHYPDTVGGFFIVNTNRVFNFLWPTFRTFLPEATAKKIKVGRCPDVLLDSIELSQIPKILGGDCDYCGDFLVGQYGPWNPESIGWVRQSETAQSTGAITGAENGGVELNGDSHTAGTDRQDNINGNSNSCKTLAHVSVAAKSPGEIEHPIIPSANSPCGVRDSYYSIPDITTLEDVNVGIAEGEDTTDLSGDCVDRNETAAGTDSNVHTRTTGKADNSTAQFSQRRKGGIWNCICAGGKSRSRRSKGDVNSRGGSTGSVVRAAINGLEGNAGANNGGANALGNCSSDNNSAAEKQQNNTLLQTDDSRTLARSEKTGVEHSEQRHGVRIGERVEDVHRRMSFESAALQFHSCRSVAVPVVR